MVRILAKLDRNHRGRDHMGQTIRLVEPENPPIPPLWPDTHIGHLQSRTHCLSTMEQMFSDVRRARLAQRQPRRANSAVHRTFGAA